MHNLLRFSRFWELIILDDYNLYADFHNNIRRKDTNEIVTPSENEVY